MHDSPELKILFATKFTDACFGAIRAVAQLADAFRVSITIVHVDPVETRTNRELQSFFAEADHYESCRRVQLHGNPHVALTELVRKGGFDLVLVPRSDRLGIPRPFHRSLRATLLRTANTPVWTGARWLDTADFLRPFRTIAVGIDGRDGSLHHVRLAASFASHVGADLRLLSVVPNIHEGTLVSSVIGKEPLSESAAKEHAHALFSGWSQMPTVDVAIGPPEKEIPRMAQKCGADLLFLNEAQGLGGALGRQISRTVDESPCGVIAVSNSMPPTWQWTFARAATSIPTNAAGAERIKSLPSRYLTQQSR